MDRFAGNIAEWLEHLEHPLVRRAYPPEVAEEFLRLWDHRGAILDALDQVPLVVCHGDAQRRNQFARRERDGTARTMAIDWANLRAAPAGADAKTLVHQALMYFDIDVDAAARFDREIFAAYVDGLRSASWTGDERAVRYGYAVQMVLGSGLIELRPILRMALDESRRGWYEAVFCRSIGEILDGRAAIGHFLLSLMGEIRDVAG